MDDCENIYSAKILIVDDEDSIRQTFEIFLKGRRI
jgi:DNA-binding NtrC family response regulator